MSICVLGAVTEEKVEYFSQDSPLLPVSSMEIQFWAKKSSTCDKLLTRYRWQNDTPTIAGFKNISVAQQVMAEQGYLYLLSSQG